MGLILSYYGSSLIVAMNEEGTPYDPYNLNYGGTPGNQDESYDLPNQKQQGSDQDFTNLGSKQVVTRNNLSQQNLESKTNVEEQQYYDEYTYTEEVKVPQDGKQGQFSMNESATSQQNPGFFAVNNPKNEKVNTQNFGTTEDDPQEGERKVFQVDQTFSGDGQNSFFEENQQQYQQ